MNSLDDAISVSTLDGIFDPSNARSRICAFTENGWRFDYYHHTNDGKNLIVFFPSAFVPGKRTIPTFQRWSWSPLFEEDILCVSDPTVCLDHDMLGGWFQGRLDDWVLPRILQHVSVIQKRRTYRKVTFCGSSLGGFAALQAAVLAPSFDLAGIECRVLAENPQTNLMQYIWRSHTKKLARVCYNVSDLDAVPDYARARLDLGALIEKFGVTPQGLVVVKESDEHHHKVHVNYLRDRLAPLAKRDLRFEVIPIEEDASGHTALSSDQFIARFKTLS